MKIINLFLEVYNYLVNCINQMKKIPFTYLSENQRIKHLLKLVCRVLYEKNPIQQN